MKEEMPNDAVKCTLENKMTPEYDVGDLVDRQ